MIADAVEWGDKLTDRAVDVERLRKVLGNIEKN